MAAWTPRGERMEGKKLPSVERVQRRTIGPSIVGRGREKEIGRGEEAL